MTKPGRVRFYPRNSVFRKSDLIDRGCSVFLKECPAAYKRNTVCARHYDGQYKTFSNYCVLEYENCNTWRREYEASNFTRRVFLSDSLNCCDSITEVIRRSRNNYIHVSYVYVIATFRPSTQLVDSVNNVSKV